MANPNWQPNKLSKAEQRTKDNVKASKSKDKPIAPKSKSQERRIKIQTEDKAIQKTIKQGSTVEYSDKITKAFAYTFLKLNTELLNREIKELLKNTPLEDIKQNKDGSISIGNRKFDKVT